MLADEDEVDREPLDAYGIADWAWREEQRRWDILSALCELPWRKRWRRRAEMREAMADWRQAKVRDDQVADAIGVLIMVNEERPSDEP